MEIRWRKQDLDPDWQGEARPRAPLRTEYRERFTRFDALVEAGTIGSADLEFFECAETAGDAWAPIRDFWVSMRGEERNRVIDGVGALRPRFDFARGAQWQVY